MSRKRDRLQNMMEANKRLLGESFHQPDGTPIGVDSNHMPIVKEDHEDSDSGKIDYIKGALKNLSSDNLNKIYLSVEKYDPDYITEHVPYVWDDDDDDYIGDDRPNKKQVKVKTKPYPLNVLDDDDED
jgi:hypothetical protein